ncbi:NADPH-dependent F420 reductase [Novosphingobium sp. BL-52-GroH]|uniref:NADPH-dependent F420 reductase n=1 Tax=Novosphingobium sp. BL-52-GroH TaxID=3349877 RepID=UPI00384A68C1
MSGTVTIAVIGGTGSLGAAIAGRLARAGHRVVVGSRDAERAQEGAAAIGPDVIGMSNADAARAGDLLIVAVPFAAQQSTLAEIAPGAVGKIVVDTTVPLVPPKVMRVQLPAEGSAAVRAQVLLGEGVRVVSALHNVAADRLASGEDVACDVLVFGDDRDARAQVVTLIEAMGMRGLHAGSLANSAAAEAMTSVLIFLNKTYKVHGAGIRVTGNLTIPE